MEPRLAHEFSIVLSEYMKRADDTFDAYEACDKANGDLRQTISTLETAFNEARKEAGELGRRCRAERENANDQYNRMREMAEFAEKHQQRATELQAEVERLEQVNSDRDDFEANRSCEYCYKEREGEHETGCIQIKNTELQAEVERLRGRLADSLCKDDYNNGIEGKCTDGRLDGPCFDDRCPHWQPKEGGE
jgi:DNA repair ATPase RecN